MNFEPAADLSGKALNRKGQVMRLLKFILVSLILMAMLLACKEEPKSSQGPVNSVSPGSTQMPGEASPEAAIEVTDGFDPNCLKGDNQYDSCIFFKNPVYQNKGSFSSAINFFTDMESVQTYGVKLKSLDDSGYLQNSSFGVKAGDLSRAKKNSRGNWKYHYTYKYSDDSDSNNNYWVGQIMAFYWLNREKDLFKEKTGTFYASDRNISVITYQSKYPNAHWDSYNNEIVMGDINGNQFALSAEIFAHELGHANFYYANSKLDQSQTLEKSCGTNRCCVDSWGCIGAINEGLADYHAAVLFNEGGPQMETIVNDVNGISECGITRNIRANKDLAATRAYSACAPNAPGEIHLMGRIYASIWWEVRSKPGNQPQEVDTLFTEHLALLSGMDSFDTAIYKIKVLDRNFFNSKYSKDFDAELIRHGMVIK